MNGQIILELDQSRGSYRMIKKARNLLLTLPIDLQESLMTMDIPSSDLIELIDNKRKTIDNIVVDTGAVETLISPDAVNPSLILSVTFTRHMLKAVCR